MSRGTGASRRSLSTQHTLSVQAGVALWAAPVPLPGRELLGGRLNVEVVAGLQPPVNGVVAAVVDALAVVKDGRHKVVLGCGWHSVL